MPPDFDITVYDDIGPPLPIGTEVLVWQNGVDTTRRARVARVVGTCCYNLSLHDSDGPYSEFSAVRLWPSGEGIFWIRGWGNAAELCAARALFGDSTS